MITIYSYTDLPNDGRVQRSIDTLSKIDDVTVVCKNYQSENNLAKVSYHETNSNSYLMFVCYSFLFFFRNFRGAHYFHDYYLSPIALLGKVLGRKVIYDMHEFLPSKKMTARTKFFVFFESLLFKVPPVMVFPEVYREKLARRYYHTRFPKSEIIRNIGGDNDMYVIDNLNQLANQSSIKLVYQGVVSKSRCLSHLIEAVAEMENVVLTIIGAGDALNELKNIFNSVNRFNNVRFMGQMNRTALYEELKEQDIGIVVYGNHDPNNRWPAPNKVYEYSRSGLPIISSNQVPLRELISKYGIGFVFDVNSINSMELQYLIQCVVENRSQIRDQLLDFNSKFNEENEQRKLLDFYKSLHPEFR